MRLLLCAIVVTAALPASIPARTASNDASARPNSWLKLRDEAAVQVEYRGEPELIAALTGSAAEPRALATGDFNGDSAPDLVAGYAFGPSGIVTIQRGNADAYAPDDESVFARMQQGYDPASLIRTAVTYSVPEPADFLQVGDFNGDHRKDVLVGAHGGGLFLLPGDGRGGLAAPERINLDGGVTALVSGEFGTVDGKADVAVAVNGRDGPQLLIFDGAGAGIFGAAVRLSLQAEASAARLGPLDDDPFTDLAVAAGHDILVVHGWAQNGKPDLQSRVESIDVRTGVRGLDVGFFVWNREGSGQVAFLTDTGRVKVLKRIDQDETPFTEREFAARTRNARANGNRKPVEAVRTRSWSPDIASGWTTAREISTPAFPGRDGKCVFRRTHFSPFETDDLVVGCGESGLRMVRQAPAASPGESAGELSLSSLTVTSVPVVILAPPPTLNGRRDLVTLRSSDANPTIIPFLPTATIAVDRIDDPAGAALPAASVCGGGAGDCSLRGAIQFANANAGTVITLPSGTYTLLINGTGAGGCDGNTTGDLGINQSTTINGGGSASTIIRQHGTGLSNNGDRVMCLNEGFLLNIIYSFSGMSIVGGRDSNTSYGGAGIIAGEKGNALTLTNVVIANNQVLGANLGGSGVQILGGDLTITNCTIGGTSAPGLPADRDSTVAANSESTSGGGIAFDPSAPTHDASTGNLVISGTTFNRNTAAGGGGGAIDTFTTSFNGFTAGTGTFTISNSTFTNNQATAGNGGAILVETFGGSVGSSSFTTNSAAALTGHGGAIYVGGGTGVTLDGTSGTLTFTGNTAPGGGSSVSTAGILNVSGTGVSIGGSVEVSTNGTWTNLAGSTLAPTDIGVAGGIFTCNNSTMNVAGNLSITHEATKGGIFNGNTSTVNIQGNLSVDLANGGSGALGQFNAGTGLFNFNGGSAQAISGPSSPTFNNLIVAKTGGTLTLGVSAPVAGNLSLNSGIFDLGAFASNRTAAGGTLTVASGTTLKIGGTGTLPSNFSTHSVGTTSTIEYSGTNQTVAALNSAQIYGHLTISGSGTKTLAAATTTAGNVTLAGGTLDVSASNFAMNVAGNWTGNGGALLPRAGTVTFNNAVAGQAINGTAATQTFNNLTLAKGAQTLAVGGSTTTLALNGAMTLTSGTLDAGTAAAINIGGDWTNNGVTFTPGASTVTFNNTGAAQTINGTAAVQSFNGLAVAKTAQTLSVGGSTTSLGLGGTMTLTSGTFSAGTAAAIGIGGNWTNNGGIFTPGGGGNTVSFTGVTANGINGTALSQSFNHVTVNKAGSGSLAVGGSTATLTLGGTMTLTAGTFGAGTATAINMGGDWTNNGATFTPAASTVTFNNTAAAQAINGTSAAQTFNGIAVAKTAQTLSVGGSTTSLGLGGTMTLTSGTFSSGTATGINVGGNWTNNGGIFTPGGGGNTVSFTGVTANGINGTALSQSFNNVTVNKAGGGSLAIGGSTATLTLGGTMTLTAGTFGAGTATAINVGGDWANNGATFTPAASTVTFNNTAAAQSINGTSAAQSFNSIAVAKTAQTLSVGGSTTSLGLGGTMTLTSGTFSAGTATGINVGGNWTNNGGTFTPGTGLVTFNGSGAQAIGGTAVAQTFNDLAVNKTAGTLSAAGSTTTLGFKSVTLTQGTLANGTASAINLSGNWTNNGGTFTGGSGAVAFNGGAAQTIGGSTATAFNSLTINNGAGVTLGANESATGVLTLTAGDLNTTTFTLTMPAAASSAGTTDVIGNVKRTGFVSGGAALSFGNPFNSIQILSGTAPTDINVNLVKTVPASFTAAVTRTYTITPNGGSGISAKVRMHYLDAELNGNTEGAGMKLFRFDGTAWQTQDQTASDTVNNWAERTGVTSFSPWTLNSTEGTPKESSGPATPQKATKGAGTSVNLTFTAACGATNHTVYWGTGPISGAVVWTSSACGLGLGPAATFDPGDPAPGALLYWVIVGQTGLREGSYGQNSSAVELPEAIGVGSCDRPQVFSGACP